MKREHRNQQHQDNDKPVERVFNQIPINHLRPRSIGSVLSAGAFVEHLRNCREYGKTKDRHQRDGNPVGKIPSDDILGHYEPQ